MRRNDDGQQDVATLFFISVRTATIRPHAPLVRDSLPAVSANPTQWAAVSAYCEHEAGAAADHLGHHEHKHQGEVDDESWPKGGGVDVDCSFCHAASCTALPSGTGLPTLDLAIATIRGGAQVWLLAGHFSEPERPKWRQPA
ncbi:hypothetical protein [Thauera chlorobenzoica]|uniref:DUF2946 domain-containing protein n=1 Tax=Thauera chlorobenzoica TaxID=96773 RepID=A0A1L6FED8_9RHOO|nr:hypothetical protein [Thauera chlorobenzoica]APR05285.1 hypothetical protein Tchl_2453 [Thauera chlorobenzoica]